MNVELVVAGNLLMDDLVHHDGETRMGEPGGGALYVSLAASLWGAKVGLVSRIAADYPAHAIEALRARAVDLEGLRAIDGPSFRTWLLYERSGRQIVRQIQNPTHASVSPDFGDVPESYRSARAFHVCPMPLELQQGLVTALRAHGCAVTLDPHETVREDNLETWREFLGDLTLFFLSHEELLLREAASDPGASLARLGVREPTRRVFLKRGDAGGIAWDTAEGRAVPWETRATGVADTTGAGDAFAGGVLAGWLHGESWDLAIQRGVVAASFAIESWGPSALIAATRASAERRRLDWFGPAGGSSHAAPGTVSRGASPA